MVDFEELFPMVEVPFELDADSLCGQRGLNEIAVVCLVIGFQ